MPDEPVTLEQVNAKLDTLQKTLNTLAETVHDDVNDLSKLKVIVENNNAIVKSLLEQLPQQTRTIRDTVEKSIDINMQPIGEIRKILSNLFIKKPKVIYFIKGTSLWELLFRRKRKPEDVMKEVSS